MMRIPVIGLTSDWRSSGHYSLFPWYALRQNYCDSVANAGGLPLVLPFHPEKIEQYLDSIDGLIVTGGDFDVDPSLYGEEAQHERVVTIHKRTQFEFELIKQALSRNMPVLGICGGHQLLNVVLGGSLIQHIPAQWPDPIEHEQKNPRNEPGHELSIETGTILHTIYKSNKIDVNSAHHQAIKEPGEGVIVTARAPDGIIEGIEVPKYKFCLGVQWHPEYALSDGDANIFEFLIRACL